MIWVNLAIFLASCFFLIQSGNWLVKSLTKIAAFLRLSEFVVGFIIMAFATSVPELFVGITSAFAKNSALSLGNVIGANIINLTLVVGITVLLSRGIKIESKKTRTDALYMVFIAALPMVLMVIGRSLSRVDGVILLFVFAIYARRVLKQRKSFKKEVEDGIKRKDIVFTTIFFVLSLALLFLSAKFVVDSATELSVYLELPPIIVGLFILSIGTTLPELTFGSRAAMKGHPDMALGNSIGSVVVNSTLVLGVVSIIHPITSNILLFSTSAIFMVVIAFLFATFVESGNKLYIKEGISLIMLYILFVVIEFYIKTV
ncbi:MAG: calcium/sodium antiporter [Candidatus Nanoarchaeia archaeon]|nr:calcium/sodium antiporter [Candidatus Nanoarchaeia archaeon]